MQKHTAENLVEKQQKICAKIYLTAEKQVTAITTQISRPKHTVNIFVMRYENMNPPAIIATIPTKRSACVPPNTSRQQISHRALKNCSTTLSYLKASVLVLPMPVQYSARPSL